METRKSQQEEERNPRDEAMEAAFVNQMLGRNEQYARQDRLLARLNKAETPQEVAPCLGALRRYENWDYQEAINQYRFQTLTGQALDNAEAFKMTHQDLIDEGVVIGTIDENGYLVNGSVMRFDGYTLRVDEVVMEETVLIPEKLWEIDTATGERKLVKHLEKETIHRVTVEKPNFGKEDERLALGEASEELARQLIVGQKLHNETGLFDANRAALEEMVKFMYIKQVGLSNQQMEWFFTAADISKITPENQENKELGEKRDRSMRMMRLIGQCETKEKFEKYLNTTFGLEQILDEKTIERVLQIMKGFKIDTTIEENDSDKEDKKYEMVVKFLLGKDTSISWVEKIGPDGNFIKIRQYEMGGWITQDERDPEKVDRTGKTEEQIEKEISKRGANAVKKQEQDVRGWLTKLGNVYSRGEKDLQYAIAERLTLIIGDKFAVRDADRMFWTRGEKDELGAEIYSFKKNEEGETVPNLPTGEELVQKWNEFKTDEDWIKWGRSVLRRFSLPGEPVGSDLSKLFWTYLYRLKDQLNKRPTGLLLSTDKVERLSQSLLSLCRTEIETVHYNKDGNIELDDNGNIKKFREERSLREQWDGYKGDEVLAPELPKNLGDLGWLKVRTPEEVEEVVVSEKRDVGTVDWDEAKNVPKALRDVMKAYEEGNIGDFAKEVEKFFNSDDTGVGDNADAFWKLMNFLAGDGNYEKRPWAYLTRTQIDPKALTELDFWTAKIKFLSIIYGASGAFGDYRKVEREAVLEARRLGKDFSTKDLLRKEADEKVSRIKKAYYESIRSHPLYPSIRTTPIEYMKIDEATHKRSKDSMELQQIVEGLDKNQPGLAVRYGYFDANEIGNTPKHSMKIFY